MSTSIASANILEIQARPAARPVAAGSPWLVSPRFDGLFFLASALVVWLPWVANRFFDVNGFYILAAVAVTSNGPHLTSTWTRVYFDTRELRRRPFVYLGAPILIGVVVVTLLLRGSAIASSIAQAGLPTVGHLLNDPFRLLNSLILYWATYHFAAQCYGLLRLYQRRSGETTRPAHRVESVFVFSTAVAALLWRLSFGPRMLFGAEAIAPEIPHAIVFVAMAVQGICLVYIVGDQLAQMRAGQPIAASRLLFLAAVVCGFWVPFALIMDGTAAFAAAACWHGFQYLGIVYHYNRRKFAGDPAIHGARVIAWVSQPRRWPAYAALLLGLAGLGIGAIQLLALATGWAVGLCEGMVWATLTLSHYWIDGLIWKMRRGDVATTLQAGSPIPAT